MAMKNEDLFKAALNMIQVTPENCKGVNADMILYLCTVVAEAEKRYAQPSAYEGKSADQIKKDSAF